MRRKIHASFPFPFPLVAGSKVPNSELASPGANFLRESVPSPRMTSRLDIVPSPFFSLAMRSKGCEFFLCEPSRASFSHSLAAECVAKNFALFFPQSETKMFFFIKPFFRASLLAHPKDNSRGILPSCGSLPPLLFSVWGGCIQSWPSKKGALAFPFDKHLGRGGLFWN